MAQYWMGLDKWVLGTYREYTNGRDKKSIASTSSTKDE